MRRFWKWYMTPIECPQGYYVGFWFLLGQAVVNTVITWVGWLT